MKIFIIGITGGVGARLARSLQDRGDSVSGLVRNAEQREDLRGAGIDAKLGDLTALTAPELAELIGPRQDVADTLAALLHEPRITQQILELNQGETPIAEAVEGNIRTH